MSQFPYAWAESLSGYACVDMFSNEALGGNELQSRDDPTHNKFGQPFTQRQNVSAAFDHLAVAVDVDHMARPLRPMSASAGPGRVQVQGSMSASEKAEHAACFPCDKPDCDEATICYDYSLPFTTCSQEAFNCAEAFDCAANECSADWLCTDPTCHEPGCAQQHAQECTPACAAVSCSDPACNQDHLYCCLSDICPHPHPPHTDCDQPPCHDACLHPPPALCHPGPASACTQDHSKAPCTVAASQDAMSTSTISTPTTDSIPTPDNLQSLIDAASILPPLGFDFSANSSHTLQQPRKRMRLHESTSSYHDFAAPYYAPHDYWPMDLSHSFSSSALSATSQPVTARASPAVKTRVRQEKASTDSNAVAICRWNDEVSGPCNRVFATIEDLHNHVKEHTGNLVASKTPARTFVCRWEGCEKDAPFGTKNHLDRHMQNHTRFKPFACNICGHRCVTQQQLNNHLTTHSREKKFKCDFPGCGKVFGVKTALSTHKRTHTNEKPFACRWCGDSYSDSSNLSKHRKTVHEDDKTAIPCPHQGCEYRDSRAQRLERHCRDHGHGLALLGDAHKWSEYTRKKQVRSRTASVAPSIA